MRSTLPFLPAVVLIVNLTAHAHVVPVKSNLFEKIGLSQRWSGGEVYRLEWDCGFSKWLPTDDPKDDCFTALAKKEAALLDNRNLSHIRMSKNFHLNKSWDCGGQLDLSWDSFVPRLVATQPSIANLFAQNWCFGPYIKGMLSKNTLFELGGFVRLEQAQSSQGSWPLPNGPSGVVLHFGLGNKWFHWSFQAQITKRFLKTEPQFLSLEDALEALVSFRESSVASGIEATDDSLKQNTTDKPLKRLSEREKQTLRDKLMSYYRSESGAGFREQIVWEKNQSLKSFKLLNSAQTRIDCYLLPFAKIFAAAHYTPSRLEPLESISSDRQGALYAWQAGDAVAKWKALNFVKTGRIDCKAGLAFKHSWGQLEVAYRYSTYKERQGFCINFLLSGLLGVSASNQWLWIKDSLQDRKSDGIRMLSGCFDIAERKSSQDSSTDPASKGATTHPS